MTVEYFNKYLDSNNLLSNKSPAVVTHNGLMFTAHYVYWLVKTSPPGTTEEIGKIASAYEACFVPNGGFNRCPEGWTKGFLNQNDDYYGLAMVSKIIKENYSERCLKIMRNNWGCLNNINPGVFSFKSFLARHPQLVATLQMSAGEKPSLWALCVWIPWLFASIFGPRDSRVKAWMSSHACYGTDPFTDMVIEKYWVAFKRYWGGIGRAEYFSVTHPVKLFMSDMI